MAAEAEAAREARAKIIKADGEKKATKYLRDAAGVLNESGAALQLRYLQVRLCLFDLPFNNHMSTSSSSLWARRVTVSTSYMRIKDTLSCLK